jgi:hypothetical protein
MSAREVRMARNEVASRELNEEIEEAYEGAPRSNRFDMVCECGLQICDRAIDITMDKYLLVRSDQRQFAIVPDHFVGDIERIIYENDRFAIVAKREGTPADVAKDGNARADGNPPGQSLLAGRPPPSKPPPPSKLPPESCSGRSGMPETQLPWEDL